MAVFVCALFTTFTGPAESPSSPWADHLPALVREKYPEGFSLGLVTAAGSLGLLFPPSLPVILYGVVAGVAIDHLYIGGLVPAIDDPAGRGLRRVDGNPQPDPAPKFEGREALRALWHAKWTWACRC